jgi:GNAT superfamily N-acetyltransferase
MIENILSSWRDYATYMGSEVYNKNNCFFIVNNDSQISCGFSNSIVCKDKENLLNIDLRNIFKIRFIQLYTIIPNDQIRTSYVASEKMASLMVLQQDNFKIIADTTDFPDLVTRELAIDELDAFTDIVFDAFDYDKKNITESLEFYKTGFKSKMVRYYGLIKEKTLVSVVLVHRSGNKSLYGLELVATSKQFQGKGYSKLLLTQVIEQLFIYNPEAIWLFSIEGSIAESLYKKIGFLAVGRILISRL